MTYIGEGLAGERADRWPLENGVSVHHWDKCAAPTSLSDWVRKGQQGADCHHVAAVLIALPANI